MFIVPCEVVCVRLVVTIKLPQTSLVVQSGALTSDNHGTE
jgi:hypothetical protein